MPSLLDDTLFLACLLAFLAGAAIPVGGVLARVERFQSDWLEQEFRHTVIAFGGGALLAAVSLILVPDGLRSLSPIPAVAAFVGGGLTAMLLDRWIATRLGSAGQLLAMLLDFVPESMGLGAAVAVGGEGGALLAFLIAIQNLPEGFNAYREITARGTVPPRTVLAGFAGLSLLGPVCALLGAIVLAGSPAALGVLLLACAGGILYLTFQDIAPQAHLERYWAPALGAVGGFALGLLGHALTIPAA